MEVHVSLVGRADLSGEIYRQLRQAMLDGRLRPGDRLPPTRELARRLSVSRTTVTVAYDRLSAEGFVRSRVGAGTFVHDHGATHRSRNRARVVEGVLRPRAIWEDMPLPRPFERRARFDFRSGLPDASLFPHVAWRRLVSRELRADAVGRGHYGEAAGDEGLRDAIARHIGVSRGIVVGADDVTVTNGTQQALDLLARVLLAPGDRVAVEDPGYPPPHKLFESHGARVTGVPVDRDGLVVDALPARTRVVYTTPSHQYPLGLTMVLSRRIALLEWAEHNNAAVIEDDYDSEFRYGGRPIEPLRSLDATGRVAYVGSFSKTLLPTLRLGFVISPPSLRDAIRRAKFITDWHSPLPLQRALARFIDSGGFARHIRRMNRVYAARHERITRTLVRDFADHVDVVPSSAGLHISALARSLSADDITAITRRAFDLGVAAQRLAPFGLTRPTHPGLVLGFGAIATADIDEGLQRLSRCFEG